MLEKQQKKVGLRTESSSRFEKGLSSENALRAINRAVELVELIGAGEVVDGKIDVYPTKQKINKIKLDYDRINGLLGTNLSKEEMKNILEKLDIKVENDVATAPYFRMDLEFLADIAEEVVRFYGYDKLETTLIKADTTIGVLNKEQKIEKNIKQVLVNNGLSEIYTYGFVSEKDFEKSNIDKKIINQSITILNPLSDEYKLMRPSTLPSMMQILSLNANKKNQDVKLFDISRNYKNVNGEVEKGEVPLQENILTIGMYGKDVDFYTLKGLIENVLDISNINRFDIEKETNNGSYHPGRCANIKVGIDVIATIGEVHPEVLNNYDIEKRVYVAEVNITKLTKYSKSNKKYVEVPKFPAVERDIAVIVDEKVEVGQIEKIIIKKSKKWLEEAKLFDIYRSDKLGQNKKSIAYSLIFRDKNKTLSDQEINTTMESIITELEKTLGAELRK
ncbi:MAG: phenylalanine--tRNA ligase subunit beta [Clostridia bacterium]|nr:phenylalanine--tRNA ligase subunit beta [Clostridia bacterium]